MDLVTSFTTGLEVADMAWEVKCREEDMKQRAYENERRHMEDARRAVDEKAQQLKAVSHLSALIAGFAMVVIVEIVLPEDLSAALLVIFGTSVAGTIGLMLIAMLNCTFMLIAVYKYDAKKRDLPFDSFWSKRCESDWRFAYRAFTIGVNLFMCVLAQVGWVAFWDHSARDIAASFVSVIAILTMLMWSLHTYSKWGLTSLGIRF